MASLNEQSPLRPSNWGQAMGVGTLWLLARLPWRAALALGGYLGTLLYFIARQRRYIVERNLELCFPELDVRQRKALARKNFWYMGRGIAEIALGWLGGPAVDRIPCRVQGMAHLKAAIQAGKPVLLLSGHFTSVELAGRLFSQHADMAVIYKPMGKKPLFEHAMKRGRERSMVAAVSKDDIRGILRTMKSGTPLWYAGDQNHRKGEFVFAPFFGIPAATTTGLHRLAKLGKAQVLPLFFHADETKPGYEITIGEPLRDFPSDDPEADAAAMNQVVEEAARARPAQYFWAHRRFKTRPEGEPTLYPGVSKHIGRRAAKHAPFPLATPPKSICILRLSALGDVTHVLPVVHSLKATWPKTRIVWIIGKLEHQLVGDLPGVEFVVVDKSRGWRAYSDLARALRGQHFDVLLQMQVSLRASLLGLTVPARLRLGFDRARARDFQWLFTRHRIPSHPRQHVLDGFFGFAETLGVKEKVLKWDIPIPESATRWAQEQLPSDRPVLAISPCSSMRFRNFRNWAPERYAELAEHAAHALGMQPVLVGGPTEQEYDFGQAVCAHAGVGIKNLIGETTLKQLIAVLRQADVVVSPDSGPAHMANAVGTPVIGLYATSNPARTGPYSNLDWVINKYPEACRRFLNNDPANIRWGQRVRSPEAMNLIEVSEVTSALDRLVQRQSPSDPPQSPGAKKA